MEILKELQEFPTIFTFKIIGVNNDAFLDGCKKVFDLPDREVTTTVIEGATSKYISLSVTTILLTFEELEGIYKAIEKVEGVKFCV